MAKAKNYEICLDTLAEYAIDFSKPNPEIQLLNFWDLRKPEKGHRKRAKDDPKKPKKKKEDK